MRTMYPVKVENHVPKKRRPCDATIWSTIPSQLPSTSPSRAAAYTSRMKTSR